MKRAIMALAMCVATLGSAPVANAADEVTMSGSSRTFGNADVQCKEAAPCPFTSMFSFVTPTTNNLASLTISSSIAGDDPLTNIDFKSVALNGINFDVLSTGVTEFRNLLSQALVSGATNAIVVTGASGGNASFAGAMSLAPRSAVPEPATWALMLMGFGAIGYSMRRRRAASFHMHQMV